jgi:tripartite-type tricarboxylate transporter receptor subunit TctC
VAAEMQPRIGQSIVVENRPGASGVTGAQSVLRAEPDGYTLLVNALADGRTCTTCRCPTIRSRTLH